MPWLRTIGVDDLGWVMLVVVAGRDMMGFPDTGRIVVRVWTMGAPAIRLGETCGKDAPGAWTTVTLPPDCGSIVMLLGSDFAMAWLRGMEETRVGEGRGAREPGLGFLGGIMAGGGDRSWEVMLGIRI